jgi:predicted nucleic acid-binding protein
MTVPDASVFVAYYHPQDPFHQASRTWLQQYMRAEGLIVAPSLVLGEVAGAITRRTGDPALGHAAVQQLRALPRLTLVPLDAALADRTAHLAAELHLRGADATYVAVAADRGLPLVTWDGEQIEHGGQQIAAHRPHEG